MFSLSKKVLTVHVLKQSWIFNKQTLLFNFTSCSSSCLIFKYLHIIYWDLLPNSPPSQSVQLMNGDFTTTCLYLHSQAAKGSRTNPPHVHFVCFLTFSELSFNKKLSGDFWPAITKLLILNVFLKCKRNQILIDKCASQKIWCNVFVSSLEMSFSMK